MDDAESFGCPACAKRYRLRAGMAGRKVSCACGERFRVPETEADEEEDGPLELADDTPAWVRQVAVTEGPRACSRCNAPLKPGAVLCLACGTDQRTGQPAAAARSSSAAEEDENNAGESFDDRWRMTATLWGINAQILALACKGLALLLGIAAGFAPGTPAVLWAGVGLELLGGLLGGLGAVLCLFAPIAVLGRVVLAASLLSYAAGFGLGLWVELGSPPGWAEVTGSLLNVIGLLLFLGFLLSLAEHLQFPEVTEAAGKVFGYTIGAVVGALLMGVVPFVGCFLSLGVLAVAVYAFWLYVSLLLDLSRSLAYRRDRG